MNRSLPNMAASMSKVGGSNFDNIIINRDRDDCPGTKDLSDPPADDDQLSPSQRRRQVKYLKCLIFLYFCQSCCTLIVKISNLTVLHQIYGLGSKNSFTVSCTNIRFLLHRYLYPFINFTQVQLGAAPQRCRLPACV